MKNKYFIFLALIASAGILILVISLLRMPEDKKVFSKSIFTEPAKQTAIAVKGKMRISPRATIVIPEGYHPTNKVLQFTNLVGSIDNPTIEGGIINTTERTPLHYASEPLAPKNLSAKNEPVTIKQVTTNPFNPSHDSWVTASKIKELLKEASLDGKLNYVLEKSEQMGLPASVALIPMVESRYQTNALSSKGAAGAWQLMPSVAKDFSISNAERFQFQPSTDVALKLLNNLHLEFGNWELALAAYNAGSQRLKTALQKNPNALSVSELKLPLETKTYVQRIMSLNQKLLEM